MNATISQRCWLRNTAFAAVALLATCSVLAATRAPASKGKPAEPPKKPDGPPTHTLARGTIKTMPEFDAVVESLEMSPLKIGPKAWADLTVITAVAHGAEVKKGDPLVKLDIEKIEEQIADLEQDRPGAALALEIAQAELANLEQTTPQRLDGARRSQRVATEDFDYFEKTGRAHREKNTRFSVKRAEQYLANANEELKQLQKMYDADDLTEETEEIILTRQKFEVQEAQLNFESTQLNTDLTLNRTLPREQENLRASRRDQELALTLAEETLPKNLTKKRADVEKMKRDQQKAAKRLADLQADLKTMSVTAPADGVVYYGACESGKWTSAAVVAKKLVPGGKLMPHEIFMTVVNPDPLRLRAAVAEADVIKLKPGMTGKAAPVAKPDSILEVRVEQIGRIPGVAGGFETQLTLESSDALTLVPGMNCKVSFEADDKKEQLLAPKDSVFADGKKRYVYLLKSDGKPDKRTVKLGATDGKLVEVLDGLNEGDKILLKRPE